MALLRTRAVQAPPGKGLLGHLGPFSADKLGFLTRCAREYGDIVPLRFGPTRFWFVSAPDLVGAFLATQGSSFRKNIAIRRVRALFGNGLLMSEGEEHDRRRRLVRPGLQAHVVSGYGDEMREVSERVFEGWGDSTRVELLPEFSKLALALVARTLFATDILDRAKTIVDSMSAAIECLDRRLVQAFAPPLAFPTPDNRRIRMALRVLNDTVTTIIEQRRRAGGAGDDLLSGLLARQPTDLTEKELRDEVMTLLLAGHETTANCLTFTCWLLARHRAVLERLRDEVDKVIGTRPVKSDDVPAMPFLSQVVSESLRLYPPGWLLAREAAEDVDLGGRLRVRRGDMIGASSYVIQRDARWFEEPDAFRPERFAPDAPRPPAYTYLPFGLGARGCVGARFALLEMGIILPTLIQRFDFFVDDQGDLPLFPQLTLRPRGTVTAYVVRR